MVKPDGLFIPNAFSPNNDGFNDIFYLFGGSGITQIQRFIVRDNFGGIVFEIRNFQPNELNLGWDGTLKGKKLQMGVFIYQVTVEYVDNSTEDFFGTVT